MDLVLTVEEPAGADDLRGLHRALSGESELRGRVRLRQRPPAPGTLGPVVEAVEVALAPGGALTVLTGAVLVWLRHRRGTVKVKVTKGKATVELTAHRIRDLDPAAVRDLVTETVAALERKD
ncbi:effector-associated constant component EACC1 [Actinosynnema sp. CS-041913]|uniref:effector-associated constant component EACC1 n=1 Tax=Actinosynnema sp. CS-041913 TaxID=3239917 RepID=UPI003D8A6FCA